MTDDIVTRLRRDRTNDVEDWWLLEPMCTEAADEIERLRAELRDTHTVVYRFVDGHCTFPEFVDHFRKAVRGG